MISGSFVPVVQYLDLRGAYPELKVFQKKLIDIDSVVFTINDEILSEDNEIQINTIDVHEQAALFDIQSGVDTFRQSGIEPNSIGF